MGYSDIATRIGAIQGTLATISGSRATAAMAPAPVKDLQTTSGTGYSGSATGAGTGTGMFGETASTEFTSLLQQALEPADTSVDEPKNKTKTTETVVAPGNPARHTAQVDLDAGVKSADGKTTGSDVVREARKYLGVPYVWGGNNPKIGLDCSSFVQHAFRDLGIDLPRVARDQAKKGTEVPSLAQAKPGDLIVTRGGGHIGIYLGENKMIHAPRPGESVSIRKLFETDAQIMTIRRIVPAASPAPDETKAVPATQIREAAAKVAELTAAAQRAAFNTAVKNP